MKRNIYLQTVTLEDALQCFEEKTANRFCNTFEEIPTETSYGRITYEPVYAKYSNPNFNASAMDGIAVISERTYQADERHPVILKKNTDFIFVDTGDLIQPPFDSVIMIEDVHVIDEDSVEILSPSHPWEHVRMVGEDFVVGEMLVTRNHKLTAVDLGALISGGVSSIKVHAQLKVGLIPTGTEIVEIGTDLKAGDILESNSRMFSGLVIEGGGIPNRYPIVPDDKSLLLEALKTAVSENDIVIINAGSSAGSEDYTASLIRELGEVWVHGIDIKPGKPAILGAINEVPVIGIPGYPVSAYMTFKHFVMPMLDTTKKPKPVVEASLSQAVPSALKHKEFVRVQLGYVDDTLIATPLKRGAASTMSLVKANGILTIDKASEGYTAGSRVRVEMTRSHLDLHKGLVAIGSHDLIMDWIADLLIKEKKESYLQSAHVGSMGGIMAIKRGEAHLAPIHLLDAQTGLYNLKDLQRYLPGEELVLIKGIKRWQGFYMRKESPMIDEFADVALKKLTFVNRQNGSGTRLLTDHLIQSLNISREDIIGYNTEVLTHTAVASAVLTGNADVGIGIESVARQMNLAYKPLAKEDYDFLIPKRFMSLQGVKDFISILEHEAFKKRLDEAGGYELDTLEYITIGGA
ncbi:MULTISPECIES: molybdopterin biosynthesis protein [unclassified Fusibacter]|uniref:molybdopterin biosynthesis protein n=1 Tax=unclassified Fusibacter TaxID=2624464 RepID=UPI0010113BCE|nr:MULTISPECIES: molybdopterin biosynthesis protein [unclassified Fusibacter]MCK8061130.1 molybdopterin biosynthesis protein [Fusibacter sp. A2]NPE23334.1 molybdopterin biosynthesis protein [Fusibacter sp. A1]RXV59377.1 molybdopterin biosynthesis protein [Fusibacter sp. A1]